MNEWVCVCKFFFQIQNMLGIVDAWSCLQIFSMWHNELLPIISLIEEENILITIIIIIIIIMLSVSKHLTATHIAIEIFVKYHTTIYISSCVILIVSVFIFSMDFWSMHENFNNIFVYKHTCWETSTEKKAVVCVPIKNWKQKIVNVARSSWS